MATTLKIGDPAPNFTAEAHDGTKVSLAALRGRPVVVYFYPKDNTSVCTAQACAFRDSYEDFVKAGATVIGISSDSLESHRQFAAERKLPFLLVSDADGSLRRAFAVPKTLGIIPGRVTYVIDGQGIVRHVFNAQFSADRHIAEALRVVQSLAAH
ncbi:MAG: peroxiredoxin [Planctomycetes bacterium]|nr:peroxiredoxin [Planctomycetota bacterium]